MKLSKLAGIAALAGVSLALSACAAPRVAPEPPAFPSLSEVSEVLKNITYHGKPIEVLNSDTASQMLEYTESSARKQLDSLQVEPEACLQPVRQSIASEASIYKSAFAQSEEDKLTVRVALAPDRKGALGATQNTLNVINNCSTFKMTADGRTTEITSTLVNSDATDGSLTYQSTNVEGTDSTHIVGVMRTWKHVWISVTAQGDGADPKAQEAIAADIIERLDRLPAPSPSKAG